MVQVNGVKGKTERKVIPLTQKPKSPRSLTRWKKYPLEGYTVYLDGKGSAKISWYGPDGVRHRVRFKANNVREAIPLAEAVVQNSPRERKKLRHNSSPS